MKLFKIKWEVILSLLMFITAVYSWYFYINECDDIRFVLVPALATVTTPLLYFGVKTFRKNALKLWK